MRSKVVSELGSTASVFQHDRWNFSRKLSSVCCCFDAVLQLANTFRSHSFWIQVILELNNFNFLFCNLLEHSWPADCPLVFLLFGRYSKSERSSLQKYAVCSIYFLSGVAKSLSSCYLTQQWGWLETWNLSTWATGLRLVVISSAAKAACFLSARGIWFVLHCLGPFFSSNQY